MSPTEILTPIVLGLAAYGYVRFLSQRLWLTLVISGGVAAWISLEFPFVDENALTWMIVALALVMAITLSRLWRDDESGTTPPPKPRKKPAKGQQEIVIDGTNVIYWDGEVPELYTLREVTHALQKRGYLPMVFFDASTRHHLKDKSLNEAGFAKALGLHPSRIIVCPAGTEADAFILKYANAEGLAVVSNDRFGDRAQQAKGIKLVKGAIAKGKPILEGL